MWPQLINWVIKKKKLTSNFVSKTAPFWELSFFLTDLTTLTITFYCTIEALFQAPYNTLIYHFEDFFY